MFYLKSARHIAQDYLAQVVKFGDHVVDATCGNGHDTLFLAFLVGDGGMVHGFDLQEDAIKNTKKRLQENDVLPRCRLYAMGHERLGEVVTQPIRAAVFNLGWLPGGDKNVTTLWPTTSKAVESALSLLQPGGIVTICAYPGHREGDVERMALETYLGKLRPQEYNVLHHRFLNAGAGAPECFIIQRQ